MFKKILPQHPCRETLKQSKTFRGTREEYTFEPKPPWNFPYTLKALPQKKYNYSDMVTTSTKGVELPFIVPEPTCSLATSHIINQHFKTKTIKKINTFSAIIPEFLLNLNKRTSILLRPYLPAMAVWCALFFIFKVYYFFMSFTFVSTPFLHIILIVLIPYTIFIEDLSALNLSSFLPDLFQNVNL